MTQTQTNLHGSSLCAQLLRFSLLLSGMAPKLCAERLVLVPKRPVWKKRWWPKSRKLQYCEQVELRAGSTWFTYVRGDARLRTNVQLTRKTFEREVGKTGPGVQVSATASPRLSCNRRQGLEGQTQRRGNFRVGVTFEQARLALGRFSLLGTHWKHELSIQLGDHLFSLESRAWGVAWA